MPINERMAPHQSGTLGMHISGCQTYMYPTRQADDGKTMNATTWPKSACTFPVLSSFQTPDNLEFRRSCEHVLCAYTLYAYQCKWQLCR